MVALHNDTDDPKTIENGERIAQFIIIPYLNFTPKIVDTLVETERGDDGFGSTGRI